MPKLKVMIASSEAIPFIKTGGLADHDNPPAFWYDGHAVRLW